MKSWPKVRLGEVLRRSDETIEPQADVEYREITVRMWGKGVIERGRIMGASLSGRRFVAHTGQFIASRIDARNGAMGLVPESLDGALVTNDFPLFNLNTERLAPAFLGWLCRTAGFVELCVQASEGTTNRVRLKSDGFNALEIPLPPLAEQRRVVARIEELAAQIHEARTLRHQAAEEADVLYPQTRDKIFWELKCDRKPIGDVFDLVNGRAFKPEEWQEKGRKIVRIQNLKYSDARYNCYTGEDAPQHLIHTGDVLFAWSGQVVSLGAHIWRDEEAILNQHIFNVRGRAEFLPEFVKEGFNALVDEMKTQVRGLEMFHIRKQEIVKLAFPVPPLAEQRRIVAELDALQAEVDALKRLQAETAAELAALLPAILDRAFKGKL